MRPSCPALEQACAFFTIQLQIIRLSQSHQTLREAQALVSMGHQNNRPRGNRMLRSAWVAVTAVCLFTSLGVCQDDGHFDASFNGAAVFTKESDGNGIRQSATKGSSYFGTFRAKFNAKHSLVFNYGRAKDSQIYQTAFDFHVLTTISEYSGAYVYSPFQKGRFEPFVLVGVAALRFNPSSTWVVLPDFANNIPNRVSINLGASKQTEPAVLYGAGVDYLLHGRIALRLQYRGFFYQAPDFKVNTTSGGAVSFVTGSRGHMAEPSIGLVFRF
jgi:opacity protein-like surface antigen